MTRLTHALRLIVYAELALAITLAASVVALI